MKTPAALTLVATFLAACGGPAPAPAEPLPAVSECPASALHPRVLSASPGLDCEAIAFDFQTAQNLVVGFGVATADNFQFSLGEDIHVTDAAAGDVSLEYRGQSIALSRSGEDLMRQVINTFIYPTGWHWPHNPRGPSAALSSYADSFRPMAP